MTEKHLSVPTVYGFTADGPLARGLSERAEELGFNGVPEYLHALAELDVKDRVVYRIKNWPKKLDVYQ